LLLNAANLLGVFSKDVVQRLFVDHRIINFQENGFEVSLESDNAISVIFVSGFRSMSLVSFSVRTNLMFTLPDTFLKDTPHLLRAPEFLCRWFIFDGLELVNGVPQ
jgi:hypothetical protein